MVGAVIVVDASLTGSGVDTAVRLMVVLLALTFIGLTTYLAARQSRAFEHLLRRQASRLQGTLSRVSGQERRVSQMLNGLDTGIARLSRGGEVLALNDTYVSLYAIDRDDPKRPGGAVEYSALRGDPLPERSEEHTSELQSLMRISYAVFCLKKKTQTAHFHLAQNAITLRDDILPPLHPINSTPPHVRDIHLHNLG